MNESDFQDNLSTAEGLQKACDHPYAQAILGGYIQGLWRHVKGKEYGTEEEHALFLDGIKSDDTAVKLQGKGYEAGFRGASIRKLIELIKTEIVDPSEDVP